MTALSTNENVINSYLGNKVIQQQHTKKENLNNWKQSKMQLKTHTHNFIPAKKEFGPMK